MTDIIEGFPTPMGMDPFSSQFPGALMKATRFLGESRQFEVFGSL